MFEIDKVKAKIRVKKMLTFEHTYVVLTTNSLKSKILNGFLFLALTFVGICLQILCLAHKALAQLVASLLC